MASKLSDAELVQRLILVEKHGSVPKAAAALGLGSSFRTSIKEAKERGLTADTAIADEVTSLQARLKIANAEIAGIKRDNNSAAMIRDQLYDLGATPPAPPKWIGLAGDPGLPGVPVTLWSDWHWGEMVSPEQVGGVNDFNRAVAKVRLKRLLDRTLDLAKRHMIRPEYPGIVVCLGGDMISGNIHDELRETNDGPLQQTILEVQDQLAMALTVMADEFGKVFVPCVVGNHGRMTLKPRAKHRVYESYEWNIYCQLERYFCNDERIQFHVPGETDAYFKVLGHRFLLTHGDALGVKGGDGIIGAIGPIARGATKVGRSEAQIGRDFDTLLMGHYHTYIPRGDATPVIVNGALKGYDEYARLMLRVPYSRPSQALFFVHEKHGITAQWPVFLDKKRKALDSAEWLTFQQQKERTA